MDKEIEKNINQLQKEFIIMQGKMIELSIRVGLIEKNLFNSKVIDVEEYKKQLESAIDSVNTSISDNLKSALESKETEASEQDQEQQ